MKGALGFGKVGIGKLIEVAGIAAIIFGILLEIALRADIGLILITAGSLVFAVGTKIEQLGQKALKT